MSSFTSDDVRHLASLARLELSDAETAAFARQLSEILEFARQVQSAEPIASLSSEAQEIAGAMLPAAAPSRDDAVRPSLAREVALANAPDADAQTGLFKVPRVLNG